VIWHCASCGTTVTWVPPIDGNPGMQKCPRCDKWMAQVKSGSEEKRRPERPERGGYAAGDVLVSELPPPPASVCIRQDKTGSGEGGG
jgi:hypothetical protein